MKAIVSNETKNGWFFQERNFSTRLFAGSKTSSTELLITIAEHLMLVITRGRPKITVSRGYPLNFFCFLLNTILLSFISSLFSFMKFSCGNICALRHKIHLQLTPWLLPVTSAFSTLISNSLFHLFSRIFRSQFRVSNFQILTGRETISTECGAIWEGNYEIEVEVLSNNSHHNPPPAAYLQLKSPENAWSVLFTKICQNYFPEKVKLQNLKFYKSRYENWFSIKFPSLYSS